MANNDSKSAALRVAESHFKMGTDLNEDSININHYKKEGSGNKSKSAMGHMNNNKLDSKLIN